jgi:hypothetical protein
VANIEFFSKLGPECKTPAFFSFLFRQVYAESSDKAAISEHRFDR